MGGQSLFWALYLCALIYTSISSHLVQFNAAFTCSVGDGEKVMSGYDAEELRLVANALGLDKVLTEAVTLFIRAITNIGYDCSQSGLKLAALMMQGMATFAPHFPQEL